MMMPPPLKQDMWGIHDADGQRAGQAANKAEPDGSQNDGQVVKSLEDIMQIMQMEWSQIMQKSDGNNKEGKQ